MSALHQEQLMLDASLYPVIKGPEGSYVDVAERARHLIVALEAISERNQRGGFVYAVDVGPHNKDIWGRYTRSTPKIQRGAEKNGAGYHNAFKHELWQAMGFSALKASRPDSSRSFDKMAIKMYWDFEWQYGKPRQTTPARNRYKKRLQASLNGDN